MADRLTHEISQSDLIIVLQGDVQRLVLETISLKAAMMTLQRECELYANMVATAPDDDEIKIGGTA